MKIGDRVTCYRNNNSKTYAPNYLIGKSGVITGLEQAGWFEIKFDSVKVPFYLPPSYLKYEVKEQKNG